MRQYAKSQRPGLPLLLLLVGVTTAAIRAEESAPQSPVAVMKSAGIALDVKKREVRIDAIVCLQRGILEYMVCLPNTFEHESIFSTHCTPSLLHLTLLTIGVEPCELDASGDWEKKICEKAQGRVRFEVEYEQDGKKVRRDVHELLVNRQGKEIETPVVWVFTGSFFGDRDNKRVYAADSVGSVVGLGLDGTSVLQIGKRTGNPYKGSDSGLKVNSDTMPARGTKVQLVFTPYAEKLQQAGATSSEEAARP